MKIGLFLSDSHNFGLVISGKVIYDIVRCVNGACFRWETRASFCVKYVKFSHLVLQVRDMVCIFVVRGIPNDLR